MTWELAPSTVMAAAGVSAGNHVLAAAGPSARTVGLGLLAALILAGLYLASCRIWPYGPCLACIGRARRNIGSSSRRWGRCRVCKGTGERLRLGTRLLRRWSGGRWPR
jgi:hypothetical protein